MATKKASGLPPLPLGLLLVGDEQRDAAIAEHVSEEHRRMVALAEQFGIPDDPHRWYALALELARQHVPALMPRKKVGRPRTWGDFELSVLVVEMDRERASTNPKKTIRDAARTLATRSPWADLLQPWAPGKTHDSDPAEALRQQYMLGRRSKWAKVARYAFKGHAATGDLNGWDAFVLTARK